MYYLGSNNPQYWHIFITFMLLLMFGVCDPVNATYGCNGTLSCMCIVQGWYLSCALFMLIWMWNICCHLYLIDCNLSHGMLQQIVCCLQGTTLKIEYCVIRSEWYEWRIVSLFVTCVSVESFYDICFILLYMVIFTIVLSLMSLSWFP